MRLLAGVAGQRDLPRIGNNIRFVAELPRNAMGKVQKRLLSS